MSALSVFADLFWGWVVWSLSHNLAHRWWHTEMRLGRRTPYAHGEREHHRVYDRHEAGDWRSMEDPHELFISFPFAAIALLALGVVALYGWLRGWDHSMPFAVAMYACMLIDHRLHIFFHKSPRLPGTLGLLQRMHLIHHQTHTHNYFFFTGWVWDVLFGTAKSAEERLQDVHSPL